MKRPKLGTKEHKEWMRKRVEEPSKKLFKEGPDEVDERGITSGSDQSVHSTDAEAFPDELGEYSQEERKPTLIPKRSDTLNV
jgi:hypothetical protein